MFFLKNKKNKLYLLDGGQINCLKDSNLNYYYDNMLKYSDYIKQRMKKYNKAIKSISDAVKKIGGDGTIHGCIVDIDCENHIYLNPQDGSILPYNSPEYGDRYEYPTVEKLLGEKLPSIYENYKKLIEASASLVLIKNEDNFSDEILHIQETTLYEPSKLIKKLQYITENNVIRIWNDSLISIIEKNVKEAKITLMK